MGTVSRIIVTGGPGSGKTSLIEVLASGNFDVCPEVSRKLIREEKQKPDGILPWTDMRGFAQRCLELMVNDWERVGGCSGKVFYDRGIPDIIAYLKLNNIEPHAELLEVIAQKRYHPVVFWCPPWQEIYRNDPERPQRFREAQALGKELKKAYEKYQYRVVVMPKVPVLQRADFILEHLDHHPLYYM
ncbi:AAA family ATPase [Fulvivirga sp. M361]|uniref:AAA family ATPase n=1 Tax=Fulvivirga sp. M361 TaxID=2594266 RepID=UPI001179E095|nr:AAA family ATPase [Fulvivirga sp. M361]TRX62759.1 AAA family ATPase [Fulvivirga sp. M361]